MIEKDRFEELSEALSNADVDEMWGFEYDNKGYYNTLKEMLAIYSKLKQKKDRLLQYNKNQFAIIKDLEKQIIQSTDAVQKDKLQYYEKELSALRTKIDFLETENKDYKDTLKENTQLKRKCINITASRATKYNQLLYLVKEYQDLKKDSALLLKNKESQFCSKCGGYKYICEDCEEDIYNTEIDKLKKENNELKEQITNCNLKAIERFEISGRAEREELKELISKLQKENEQLKIGIKQWETYITVVKQENDALKEQLLNAKANNIDLLKQL